MAAVDTVFEQLGAMSVLELVELKKKIEDEWGITAAAPAGSATASDAALRAWANLREASSHGFGESSRRPVRFALRDLGEFSYSPRLRQRPADFRLPSLISLTEAVPFDQQGCCA